MSGFLKRKCCGGCNQLGNCTEWCACLPQDATLSVTLRQYWKKIADGVDTDFGEAELNVRNVKLTKYSDSSTCLLYAKGVINGVPNGNWDYREYNEGYSAPLNSFYITPNCPANGCRTWNLATTEEITGGQNVGLSEVTIECYDPCQQPLGLPPVYPTNRIKIDIFAPLMYDFQCYGEWLTTYCGTNVPPYQIFQNLTAEIYGEWECLNQNTFVNRTLRWYNVYGDTVPQQISYICNSPCTGECKGAYTCLIKDPNGTPPFLPQYDWWSRYDIRSCKFTNQCLNSHSCWNGFYGNQPPVYSCACGQTPFNGEGTIEYSHWMESTVTLTIP
jgi:hypothetical protein